MGFIWFYRMILKSALQSRIQNAASGPLRYGTPIQIRFQAQPTSPSFGAAKPSDSSSAWRVEALLVEVYARQNAELSFENIYRFRRMNDGNGLLQK